MIGSKIHFLADQVQKNINYDPQGSKGRVIFNNVIKSHEMKIPTNDLLNQLKHSPTNSPGGKSKNTRDNIKLLNEAMTSNPSVKNLIVQHSHNSPQSHNSIDNIYHYLEEQLHKSQIDSQKQIAAEALKHNASLQGIVTEGEEESHQLPKGNEKHFRSVLQLNEPFK